MLLLLVRSPGSMPCPNYEVVEFQPRTVDNSYPRLWVPSPYSFSPTRRSKPAFQWQGTNERTQKQWHQDTKRTQDRHGRAPIRVWVYSCLPCDRRDRAFFRTAREPLHSSVGIATTYLSLTIAIYPSESFSGFRNRGPEPVTPSMQKYRSISLGPLAHAGLYTVYTIHSCQFTPILGAELIITPWRHDLSCDDT